MISSQDEAHERLRDEVDRLILVSARMYPGGDVGEFDSTPFRLAAEQTAIEEQPALAVAELAWMAPAIRTVTGAVRLVDCHDVLHERALRFDAVKLDPWARCTSAQEQRLLESVDIILTVQLRDAEVLQRLVPHKQLACLLPWFDLPSGYVAAPVQSATVLAVGGVHAGNEGIRTFAYRHWPEVIAARPNARLEVVGAIGNSMAPSPGVEWLGEIDDLHSRYAAASVVVCPIEVGTGVRMKMLEALRLGKATVATPAATEGMPEPPRPAWVVADSLAASANAVISLLDSPKRRRDLEREAFAYGETHLSLTKFVADLRALVPHPALPESS